MGSVEDLLIQKKVEFQPSGGDYLLKCLSPEHDDSNPSMRVDKITGIFHCLSCGFKGSIFSHFGEKPNQQQIRRELLRKKIQLKLAESVGFVMPQDALPYEGDWRGIKPETYIKFEAFQHSAPEYIGRIVFPIKDISGKIVAFVGRHTNMLRTPKYMINPPSVKMPLFPIVTPIKGNVILVEGIFDMLNLHDKGLTNAVCSFGTRTITKEKLELLKMQNVSTLDIMYDGDEAGRKATETVIELAESVGLSHRTVGLKQDDPGSLSAQTIEKLRKSLYG